MSLVGPHEAISGQLNEYEAAGVSPTLQRIGGYDGPDYPLDDLTARQREVIQTAWEMGYYEVPKAVSAKEIATELELDSSTVNEHLQRAERNLLKKLL
nr:helix-turn-helix domain-containing protein [Halobellus litoreus]